jgi:hypothetical protein
MVDEEMADEKQKWGKQVSLYLFIVYVSYEFWKKNKKKGKKRKKEAVHINQRLIGNLGYDYGYG